MAEANEESPVDPAQAEGEPVANDPTEGETNANPSDEQVDEAQADEADSDSDTDPLEDTRVKLYHEGFANEGDTPFSEVPEYEDDTEEGRILKESRESTSSVARFKEEGDQASDNGVPAAKVGKRTV